MCDVRAAGLQGSGLPGAADIIRRPMNTKMQVKMRLSLKILATGALALGLPLAMSGCAKDVEQRGNLPKPEALAQLQPGEQTRQDVEQILGTPSTTAVFDSETWYYISGHTTQYAFY